jgi:hypothetical protein
MEMGLDEAIQLSDVEINALPYVLTSKNIYITTSSKRRRKLFVQRFDAFTTDLVSLLNDLRHGELLEIAFRNELLGDFVLSRAVQGVLQGRFVPVNSQSENELRSRLTKWTTR